MNSIDPQIYFLPSPVLRTLVCILICLFDISLFKPERLLCTCDLYICVFRISWHSVWVCLWISRIQKLEVLPGCFFSPFIFNLYGFLDFVTWISLESVSIFLESLFIRFSQWTYPCNPVPRSRNRTLPAPQKPLVPPLRQRDSF